MLRGSSRARNLTFASMDARTRLERRRARGRQICWTSIASWKINKMKHTKKAGYESWVYLVEVFFMTPLPARQQWAGGSPVPWSGTPFSTP